MRTITRDAAKGLVIGQKVVFRSRTNVQPTQKYNGIVLGKYDNFILLEVTPQNVEEESWGSPKPYRVSVNINSIGCESGSELWAYV